MWRWGVLFVGLVAAAAHAEPARLALVVGNSTYPALPALPACAASANVIAAALKRAGFTVTDLLNPSNGRMGAAVSDFSDALAQAPGSTAVAYVCGYAGGFDSRVFLLPASARLERDTDILTQGLLARLVVGAIAGADLRAGLAVLDTMARPGIAPVSLDGVGLPAAAPGKALVAVSTRSAPPSGPTPLAAALAAGLAGPQVELGALVGHLRAALPAAPASSLVQQPPAPAWLLGAPAPAAPAPAPPAPPEPPAQAAPEPAPSSASPAPSPAAAAPTEADRRRIQLALQRLGYYSGQVDGRFGPESLAAIRRFQHELGAEMTGRLTEEQTARLLLNSH